MQIHGHDFACLAVLPKTSPPCYASGSEEKVIRVLEAPQAYEDTIALGRSDQVHASSGAVHPQVYLSAALRVSARHACVRRPRALCTVTGHMKQELSGSSVHSLLCSVGRLLWLTCM